MGRGKVAREAKRVTSNEKFASVKLPREFVAWLKVQAAKARMPMYEFLQQQLPNVPKRIIQRSG